MKAYDLDGVIAEKPPKAAKRWGRMNGAERRARKESLLAWYRSAGCLRTITSEDVVITARKAEPMIISATREWFYRTHGFCPTIEFLDRSRTIKNVVEFKAAMLEKHGVTEFYEDNKVVLRGIHKLSPTVDIFFVAADGSHKPLVDIFS